jgi:osmotically-inducible protein OsmY
MSPSAISARRIRPSESALLADELARKRPSRVDRPAAGSARRRASDLKDRIVEALDSSGYAALSLVRCEVDNNRVILRGSVPSYHLKQLAQVHALRVEGIGRLENRLEVRGRASY